MVNHPCTYAEENLSSGQRRSTSSAENTWQQNLLEDLVCPAPRVKATPFRHGHFDLRVSVDTVSVRNDQQIDSQPRVVLKTWPQNSLTLSQIANIDSFGGAHAKDTTHYLFIFSL